MSGDRKREANAERRAFFMGSQEFGFEPVESVEDNGIDDEDDQ